MVFEGFLKIGSTEIVNTERARGLTQTADCPLWWVQGPECESLRDALGDDEYIYANMPLAPWYDPAIPDLSGRFYGIAGLEVTGLNGSTRSASQTEGIQDGGVIGATRKGMRGVRVRGTLIADGRDALDYGVSWLNSAVDPGQCGQHGDSCGMTDMEYFTECPPERGEVTDYTEWEETARNLATNSSFERSSGISEIRRNLIRQPVLSEGISRWQNDTLGVATSVPEGALIEQVATPAGTWLWQMSGTNGPNVTAGTRYTLEMKLTNPGGVAVMVSLRMRNVSGASSQEIVQDNISIAPGQTVTVGGLWTAPAGSTRATPLLHVGAGMIWPQGASLIVHDNVNLEASTVRLPSWSPIVQEDLDLIPSWTGATNDSPSILSASRASSPTAGSVTTLNITAIQSRKWALSGANSLRLMSPTGADSFYQVMPYNLSVLEAGRTYTALATARLEAPLAGTQGEYARSLMYVDSRGNATSLAIATAPNVAGEHPLRITFTVPASGASWAVVRLYNGATSGEIWWDDFAIMEGVYDGDWFNGDSDSTDLTSYSWAGDQHLSASIRQEREAFTRPRTDDEYAALIEPYRRFLHDVSVTSGPIPVEIFRSKTNEGFYGMVMEWTITSERAWIYSTTRNVNLPITPSFVIDDLPVNLVPYPSAELAGDPVVASTNYSLNPSLESNANGWTGVSQTYTGTNPEPLLTYGRVTGELQAVGASSYRMRLLGDGVAATGRAKPSLIHDVDVSSRPAGSRVSVSVWAAGLVVSGASVSDLISLEAIVYWLDASDAPILAHALGVVTEFDGHVFEATSLAPPAAAVSARVQVSPTFDWASGSVNSDIRFYVDAVAVTVP